MTNDPLRRPVVLLIHHAEAVGPDIDPQRPLSRRGRTQAEWVAAHIKKSGVPIDVVWHSGKLRARQTAEALLLGCNPLADFRMVRGLRPEDSPDSIQGALAGEGESVALVSHMPLLPALLELLTRERTEFPLHGIVLLDREGPASYRERWRVAPPAGA